MNWRELLASLNEDQFRELSIALSDERNRRDSKAAQSLPPFNKEERDLVNFGQWINAIRAYRERVPCSLAVAKVICDQYRFKQ